MRYKIVSYCRDRRAHIVESSEGKRYIVDLVVDGSLAKAMEHLSSHAEVIEFEASLVGETVEIESLSACEYVGNGVKLIRKHKEEPTLLN